MRSIPASLQNKLLNRFKAASTDSEPHIKLIATQMSKNMLLSEPIHKDITEDFGDVAIRQMAPDEEPYCAYAICIDDGIAKIYRRLFPASMEFVWEYVFTYGAADDVAIEYDGDWVIDDSYTWYYLETEEYPYIFAVENGNLYCQKWNDTSTKTLLATGVEQISSCKGWESNLVQGLDQGLIIGYIKNGSVYYRALCVQENGTVIWESEHQVTNLGTGNETLSVIRTNDFRIGFVTENDGEILIELSKRTYPGMSVRPESMHINTNATFLFPSMEITNGFTQETANVSISKTFFNYDTNPASNEISVLSAQKLNNQNEFTSYGCKLFLDKALNGNINQAFIDGAYVSVTAGSQTTTVYIDSITYNSSDNSLSLIFDESIARTSSLVVNTVESYSLWYYRVQNQKWYLKALSASLAAETVDRYGYENETLSASSSASFAFPAMTNKSGFHDETASVSSSITYTLEPVSTEPI